MRGSTCWKAAEFPHIKCGVAWVLVQAGSASAYIETSALLSLSFLLRQEETHRVDVGRGTLLGTNNNKKKKKRGGEQVFFDSKSFHKSVAFYWKMNWASVRILSFTSLVPPPLPPVVQATYGSSLFVDHQRNCCSTYCRSFSQCDPWITHHAPHLLQHILTSQARHSKSKVLILRFL